MKNKIKIKSKYNKNKPLLEIGKDITFEELEAEDQKRFEKYLQRKWKKLIKTIRSFDRYELEWDDISLFIFLITSKLNEARAKKLAFDPNKTELDSFPRL